MTLTARRQQQNSIWTLSESREGKNTCTITAFFWRYDSRRLLPPVSSYEYHYYRMNKVRFVYSQSIIFGRLHKDIPGTTHHMYSYICDFLLLSNLSLLTSTFSEKKLITSTNEGRPEPVVEFEVDPSTAARVAGAHSFFFPPPGKDFSGSSYFVRTYRLKIVCFGFSLMSAQPRTYTTGRQRNMERARGYNAAADKYQQATPCVCDMPICAVLLWLLYIVVFIAACAPFPAAAVCDRSTLAVDGNVTIVLI